MTHTRKFLDWRLLIGVIAMLMVAIYFTMAGNTTFYVNGKAVPANEGQPFQQSGITYVPLQPIAKGMGHPITFNKRYDSTTVQKPGKVAKLTTGKTVATVSNKIVPLDTKYVGSGKKRVKVPAGHRSLMKNNILYVPLEFIQTLGYPVTVKGNVIYIGAVPTAQQPTQPSQPAQPKPSQPTTPSQPAQPSQPTQPTQPSEPPKTDDPSTATSDGARNMNVLSDRLGFYKVGTYSAIFNPYTKANGPSSMSINEDPSNSGYDVRILITVWSSDDNPEYNKTPNIAKQVFQFYGVGGVYDIVNKGFNGVNVESSLNRPLTFGNRQVYLIGHDNDTVSIFIGHPNQTISIR